MLSIGDGWNPLHNMVDGVRGAGGAGFAPPLGDSVIKLLQKSLTIDLTR